MKLKKQQKKWLELGILFLLSFIVILLWESKIVYPIKMLVIILHEISHAIVAIIAGFKIQSIEVTNNLGGETLITGQNNFFVAFAGYFGSIVFGVLFFISAYNRQLIKIYSLTLGTIILLFTANIFKGEFTIFFGIIFSLLLLILPFIKYEIVTEYIYKFIGLTSILYTLVDVKEDLLTLSLRQTDAQLLSDITGIAPILWGFFYVLLSLVALIFVFRYAFRKGMK